MDHNDSSETNDRNKDYKSENVSEEMDLNNKSKINSCRHNLSENMSEDV